MAYKVPKASVHNGLMFFGYPLGAIRGENAVDDSAKNIYWLSWI